MPLKSGKSEATISSNIATEKRANPKISNAQAAAIAYSNARKTANDSESKREHDINGWAEIKGNPISKVGVFPYTGAQISPELDPNEIYHVYRPEEELNNDETIDSFRLLPWVDDHTMLGDGYTDAGEKGIHGVIGQDVYYEDGYLKANLKIYSSDLAEKIENGKKELSIGYRCLYDLSPGVYDGIHYDAVQRQIRGNHLATVDEGRSGADVAVLDHFKLTLDSKDLIMQSRKDGETKAKDEGGDALESLAKKIEECMAALNELRKGKAEDGDADPDDFVERADVTDEQEAEATKEDTKKAAESGDAAEEPEDYELKKKDQEMKSEDEDESEEKEDKRDKESASKEKGSSSMDSQIKALQRQVKALTENGEKTLLRNISRRDALASELSKYVGTFDHKEKTLSEVAAYGVKKLGLRAQPGHESSVLDGYLAARRANGMVATGQDRAVAPSKGIDAYINGGKK